MNDLSLSFSSLTLYLLCVISIKRHIYGKSFYAERTPPNSPLVHIKSKWKKEWPQWGSGGGGGVDGGI